MVSLNKFTNHHQRFAMKRILLFLTALFAAALAVAQVNVAGSALQYNGTSCVNFGSINLGFQNQLTIMLWVRWDTLPSLGNRWSNMATINSNLNADDGVFWIQHNSDNSKFEYALTTIGATGNKSRNMVFSTTSPQQGVWYHLAATYNGALMSLYVNGVLEASTTKTGQINGMLSHYYFTLGAWAHSNNNYRKFDGSIDEMSVWSKALSVSEIQTYKNHQLSGTENQLLAYWRFDESTGSTIFDLSPAGLNGQNISCANATAASRIMSDAPIYSGLLVNLLYFQPSCGKDSNVVITWATASEVNNDFFTLFRSYDGSQWEIVDRIDGAGNTNQVTYYSYTDKKPENKTIYYKLMQTDFDGSFEEFESVSVYCINNEKQFSMYPNPTDAQLNISFNNASGIESTLQLAIFDRQGQLQQYSQQISVTGFNEANLNVESLAAGHYFLHVKFGNLLIQTREFIKL